MSTKKEVKKTKPAAKKATPKKVVKKATKPAAKKATPKKVVKKATKPAAKKATPKKVVKKATPKKATPKKTVAKKVAPKKAVAKKVAPKKTTSKKVAPKHKSSNPKEVTLGKKVLVRDVLVYNKPKAKKDKLVTTTTVQRQSDIDRKRRQALREKQLANKLTASEKRQLEKAKAKAEAILQEAKQRELEKRLSNTPEALLAKREEELKKLAEELKTREMELKNKELLNEKGEVVPVAPSKLEELEAVLAKNKKVMEEKFKERESEIRRRRLMEEEATNRLYMLRADITRDLEDLRHDVAVSVKRKDELEKEVRALEKEVKLHQIKISSKNAELTIIEEHKDEHFDLNTTEIDAEKLDLSNKLAIAQASLEEKQQALLLAKNQLIDKEKHLTSKAEAGEKEIIEAEMALEDLKKHLDINKMVDVIAYDKETTAHLERLVNKNISAVADVKEENQQQDGYKTVVINLRHSKFDETITPEVKEPVKAVPQPIVAEESKEHHLFHHTPKKEIVPIVVSEQAPVQEVQPVQPVQEVTPVAQPQPAPEVAQVAPVVAPYVPNDGSKPKKEKKAKEPKAEKPKKSAEEKQQAKAASKQEMKDYLNQEEKIGKHSIKLWVSLLISGGIVVVTISLIFVLGFIL